MSFNNERILKIILIGEPKNRITILHLLELIKLQNQKKCAVIGFIDATVPKGSDRKVNHREKVPFSLILRKTLSINRSMLKKIKFFLNGNKEQLPSVYALCRENSIDFIHSYGQINSGIIERFLKNKSPDIGLIAGCDQILRDNIIKAFNVGCINYHYSPLPKYAGKMAVFWQLVMSEPKIGFTYHWVDAGIDTGDPIVQDYVTYFETDSFIQVIKKVITESVVKLSYLLDLIRANKTETIVPVSHGSRYLAKDFVKAQYLSYHQDINIIKKIYKYLGYLKLKDDKWITKIAFATCNYNYPNGKIIKKNLFSIDIYFQGYILRITRINYLPIWFYPKYFFIKELL